MSPQSQRNCLLPGVCEQIKKKVAKCEICNKYRNCQIKEPLLPHPLPDRPWQVLAADLFVLPQGKFVVLVDYYSKYFELTQLKDSTSATLINCLQQHMSRHGIPEILYSDNGLEFSSLEFRQFVKAYQFQHVTSSCRFPQSNGLAERTVQTATRLLKKAYEERSLFGSSGAAKYTNSWSGSFTNTVTDGESHQKYHSY